MDTYSSWAPMIYYSDFEANLPPLASEYFITLFLKRHGNHKSLLMAHRYWQFAELVRNIAAILVSDDARASAVALATCSKSLEEPALAEVWRELPSLLPLIKCFPPDVWKIKDEELTFKRAPLHAEWTRFQQQYASKVRHLKTSDEEISLTALQVFQLYSPCVPLLANLVSINWKGDDTLLPFISLFISSSLSSIEIEVPSATPLLPPILTRLSASSREIREIQIQSSNHDPSMQEACSQLLMHCNSRHLRIFNIDSYISASALRHIIQLPFLEDVWLVFDSVQLPDPIPSVVFPSLQSLDVGYCGDITWLKLLSAIENPVLTSISVRSPSSDVAQFMESFQLTMIESGLHECLQNFHLRCRDAFEITPQIIACNLSFSNMKDLKLFSRCSSSVCQTRDLTNGDIDLLTKAMPLLETLSIGEQPCDVLSKITFKTLSIISRRCTRLKALVIHFDPTSFISEINDDSESVDDIPGLSNFDTHSSELSSLTEIDVGEIPLARCSETANIMALGLRAVFPKLNSIVYENYHWEGVDELIELFNRVGRCTFEKGS